MLAPKDNLETRCQSRKRGIIQSNIYGNLPKVNQVIYTLDTIYVPNIRKGFECHSNIMILAQAVLQIFCWQGSIGLQCTSWKRGIIQLNNRRILWKVNVRHNLWAKYHDPSSSGSPDILLRRFHRFTMHKSKKGDNSAKLIRSSTPWTKSVCQKSWS